jgi:hypothetical protein
LSHIKSRHVGENLNVFSLSETKALNSCRQSIEHDYGQGAELFPHLNYTRHLKLMIGTPLQEICFSKLLFRNLHVMVYYNVTGSRFIHCPTPSVEDYMQPREND